MLTNTTQLDLTFTPRNRFELIDVQELVRSRFGEGLRRFPRVTYQSYHTTGGFFEQSLCARLDHCRDSLEAFIRNYQRLFPPGADYSHDQLHLRHELSETERDFEPLNGDSHLTFIGSGLANCVTYENCFDKPVYFVDLDGVYRGQHRRRRTTVVAYRQATLVGSREFHVPVSLHPIDSVNLNDRRLGLYEEIDSWLRREEVERGRVDISLAPEERHVGLTVNEYETLLMKHDLVEVLQNPLRFMAERGKHMLMDPRSIPGKAKNYAKYDLVLVVNRMLDSLRLNGSLLEKLVNPFLAVPASHFLQMKRAVSFLVCPSPDHMRTTVMEGTYQSPILVQWRKARTTDRLVRVDLYRFE